MQCPNIFHISFKKLVCIHLCCFVKLPLFSFKGSHFYKRTKRIIEKATDVQIIFGDGLGKGIDEYHNVGIDSIDCSGSGAAENLARIKLDVDAPERAISICPYEERREKVQAYTVGTYHPVENTPSPMRNPLEVRRPRFCRFICRHVFVTDDKRKNFGNHF